MRATEEIVALALDRRAGEEGGRPKRRPKPHAPALTDLADRLSDRFDTRVKVDIGRSKGKITIEFATVDDLERIVGIIGVQQEESGGLSSSRLAHGRATPRGRGRSVSRGRAFHVKQPAALALRIGGPAVASTPRLASQPRRP